MKNLLLLTAFIFLLITSCKKKESTPAPAPATTGGTTTGGSPNGSGTTNYDVLFEILKTQAKVSGNFLSPTSNCKALLCTQTVSNEVQVNFLNMGSVNLNNVTFANHLSTINYYYVDSTYTNFTAPYSWSVSGSANFTSTSFTNTTSFPVYPSYTSLPDSISKSAGYSLSLNGLSGCDFVQIQIIGPSGSQYLSPKLIAGNAANISFSASELTGLNTGSNGYFTIKFMKDNVQVMNNKKVNLRSGIMFTIFNFKIIN